MLRHIFQSLIQEIKREKSHKSPGEIVTSENQISTRKTSFLAKLTVVRDELSLKIDNIVNTSISTVG